MKTRTKWTTAILSSILALAATLSFMFMSSNAYSQFLKSYRKLTKPEQHWVLWHPIAAYRTHHLADSSKREAIRRLQDKDLDADINGGMVDAFKHTLWMALTAQKVGRRRALSLGDAHEESAYLEFVKDPNRKSVSQDSIASRMDALNNQVGVDIARNHPKASFAEMVVIVKEAVMQGKCWKIKKKDRYNYLDENDAVIKIHDYDGQWYIPKVLVPSNY